MPYVRSFAEEYSRSEFSAHENPPSYLSPMTCDEDVTFTALVKFGSEEDQWIWTVYQEESEAGVSAEGSYAWGLKDGKLAMKNLGGAVSKAASYTVPRNKWLLVTYTKVAGTAKPIFYIWDYEAEALTVVVGSTNLVDAPTASDSNLWIIGDFKTTNGPERFTGTIAAHAIWEGVLSEAEVLSGLIEVDFLTEWVGVDNSELRGLWYWNQVGAEENIDRSGTLTTNASGSNTEIKEEEPPVPYQPAEPPNNIDPPTLFEFGEPTKVNYFSGVATFGNWDGLPEGYSFIWERSEDSGSTWQEVSLDSVEYEFSEEDEGFLIRLAAYAHNQYGKSDPCHVGPLGPIGPALTEKIAVNTVAPVLSGTPRVGETLETSLGTWTHSFPEGHWTSWYKSLTGDPGTWILVSTSYQFHFIEGADEGYYLKARVGASYDEEDEDAGPTSVYSNVVGPVDPEEEVPEEAPPVNTVAPQLAGTPAVGETIEADEGTWTNAPESYEYQWEKSHFKSKDYELISGETTNTLDIDGGLDGYWVRVRVTAVNGFGSTQANSLPDGVNVEVGGSGVFMVIDHEVVEVERFMLISGDLVPV